MTTPTFTTDQLDRVEAGIAWLNDELPDWRNFVNVEELDMAWSSTCVLGQYVLKKYIGDGFNQALHAYLNDSVARAYELGFMDLDFDYAGLTEAWRHAIKAEVEVEVEA